MKFMSSILDVVLTRKTIAFVAVLIPVGLIAQPPPSPGDPSMQPPPQETGLILKESGVADGYTLIATRGYPSTFLIDNAGHVVHEWKHDHITSLSAYLLPNGNLLHVVAHFDGEVGDIVQELTWEGDVVWQYTTDRDVKRLHHDVERLPNGNTLITVWEKIEAEEYLAAGRDPDLVPDNTMWVDAIYEVKPTGKTTGEVVWRWSAWDHLIQDHCTNGAYYGNPADQPNRIDVNEVRLISKIRQFADWLHINAVAYSADRDELILSVHALSEMWVISRETGEILYRWGNPRRYGKGSEADQILHNQHDPHWIPEGLRGAGNILIFNNEGGADADGKKYSSVLEIRPPLDPSGAWPAVTAGGYPSAEIVWRLDKISNTRFYAAGVSNAQRLKNGNTLVTAGVHGEIFEVNPDGEIVWKYVNPIMGVGRRMKKLEKWNNKAPPRGENVLFRAYKYAPDYPAFSKKAISPKRLLKENR